MNTNYNTSNVKLTSAEITSLWSSYIFVSLMHHIFSYFISNVEDEDIHTFVEYARLATKSHINSYTAVFQNENLPVPRGTISGDVKVNAPRLFSDKFYITYMKNMVSVALGSFTVAYAGASRADIRRDYIENNLTVWKK